MSYWSTDKAGNTETTHKGYARIDSKAPRAAAKPLSVKAAKAKKGKTLKIKVTIRAPHTELWHRHLDPYADHQDGQAALEPGARPPSRPTRRW